MLQINQKIDIVIYRKEANFDRACDAAYEWALSKFEVDECGHINAVENSRRSTDSLVVQFTSYKHIGTMAGQDHIYSFSAWIERHEDEMA